ncbi:hypothetical protein INT47_003185 [Mucor saturninus]|uniref:Uncharacterized protein n=1 Tax=Mucor saturninus TaxID=64648 RepID=A0A8H7QZ72_9FUNG|nr:hypothetical protein INT47_003185 [Mucor saturninus]
MHGERWQEKGKDRLLQLPVELQMRIFILAQNASLVTVCKQFWELGQSVTVRAQYLLYRYGRSNVLSKRAMKRKMVTLSVVEHLLRYRKVPVVDDWLFTYACEGNALELASWIVEEEETRTLAHYAHIAAMKGATGVLDVLARYLDLVALGNSLLSVAQGEGQLATVKYLMAKGCDVHHDQERLLRNASHAGQDEMVKFILSHGGNVHAYGEAALLNAVYKGYTGMVGLLLNAGANAQVNNNACMRAAFFNRDVESMNMLVKAGVDVTWNGDWLLKEGCRYGYVEAVEVWLKGVDDVNSKDGLALQMCLKYGSMDVLQVLLNQYHADPNRPGVHRVCKHMNLSKRMMDLLFQAGLRP